jgi:hypothetical protein
LLTEAERKMFDGGWVSFDVSEPTGCEIVQQYLGKSVMEQSNPPDWAFPTQRWRGKRDNSATHWRYVDGPCDRMNDSLTGNGPARRVSDVALPVGDSA